MLDKEQRSKVIELFGSGMNISEIARRVGVSRPSVYRVIASDVEKDAEILNLKKELRKTELQKRIDKLREPRMARNRLDALEDALSRLMLYVLFLWKLKPELEAPDCFYCGGLLKYRKERSPEGKLIAHVYECHKCGRAFPLP